MVRNGNGRYFVTALWWQFNMIVFSEWYLQRRCVHNVAMFNTTLSSPPPTTQNLKWKVCYNLIQGTRHPIFQWFNKTILSIQHSIMMDAGHVNSRMVPCQTVSLALAENYLLCLLILGQCWSNAKDTQRKYNKYTIQQPSNIQHSVLFLGHSINKQRFKISMGFTENV